MRSAKASASSSPNVATTSSLNVSAIYCASCSTPNQMQCVQPHKQLELNDKPLCLMGPCSIESHVKSLQESANGVH